MHVPKPSARRAVTLFVLALGLGAGFGTGPGAVAAADAPAGAKPQKDGAGEFVSYKDGTLTLKGRGGPLVRENVGDNYKTFERDADGPGARAVGTGEALGQLKPGMAVRISPTKLEIRYGVDEHTSGTFVSYKDGRLVLIGRAKELGESYTKKYGTSLSPQIDSKTPVEESVDGGEFKPAGTAEYLTTVKEGTVVTLRGKNDTVLRVQLGVRKQDKPAPRQPVDQKDKRGWGKLVSFEGGTLTLESNAGELLVWHGLDETTETLRFDAAAGKHLRADSTADALGQAQAGTWTAVTDRRAKIYLGAKKGQVVGTFVSFKDGRLLLLGKDLGDNSYTRKYGNNLQFNRFCDDVPVQESIDGGEYKLIGTANKVLGDVKEGTVLTVHGEGDDNITLVQIGVPKKK